MNKKGFTLIELLVVISIIGLLSSIVLASLNAAQAKARDAKRLSDLSQIQLALTLYYDTNHQYPDVCNASSGQYVSGWSTLLPAAYLSSMPNDPINTAAQYGYYYCSQHAPTGNCTFSYNPGVATEYVLATRLENPAAVSNRCPSGFSAWDNNGLNYLVGSQ